MSHKSLCSLRLTKMIRKWYSLKPRLLHLRSLSTNRAHRNTVSKEEADAEKERRALPSDGLQLSHFIANSSSKTEKNDASLEVEEDATQYSLDHLKSAFSHDSDIIHKSPNILKFHLKTCKFKIHEYD